MFARLLLLGLAVCACGPGEDSPMTVAKSASGLYQMSVFTDPAPPVRGVLSGRIELIDQHGAPAAGLTLTVTPWMPQHGHGSSTSPTVTETAPGVYTLTQLYLPMAGVWQLRTAISGGAGDEADPSLEVR